MTKEQAVKFANCLKNNYTIDFNDMADFCDMAIKALEQQPGDDCVSREEVIDELNRLGRNAFKDDTDYDNFFAFVDSLPPVTPIHGTCKDCKHNKQVTCLEYLCKQGHRFFMREPSTFYCADYEKRGNKVGWSSLENVREKVERGNLDGSN